MKEKRGKVGEGINHIGMSHILYTMTKTFSLSLISKEEKMGKKYA